MNLAGDNWIPGAILAAFIVALTVAGGALTSVGGWYAALSFPSWKPPNWAFGPIWTFVLLCTAAAIVLAWPQLSGSGPRLGFIGAGVANSILAIVWNLVFFRLRRPDLALPAIVLLWMTMAALAAITAMHAPAAALLFAPYLIWVATAALLNREIVRLNAPF